MKTFEVPGKPRVLERHRDGYGGGKYDPSKDGKESFLVQCAQHRPRVPYDFPIKLVVICYFVGPKGYHTKVPDGSNLLKFVEDGLNGIFWRDDRFIVDARVIKRYGPIAKTVVEIDDAVDPAPDRRRRFA